ncbi:hypothetical protein ABT297_04155 [Dactylosporangium sp. NPDC000555]|uniref:hypothetical protein n=1 Tax=Dactylosporangium sp. NPDC000555 TaxID=3154260 RepID=UPI0033191F90
MNATTRARRALDGLDARLQANVEDWGNHAPPRRPRLGHTADCPDNGRPMPRSGRCRFCRAEALGADPARSAWPVAAPTPARPSTAPERVAELRACTGPHCYRPTDHPSGLCDRCQPGDDRA